MCFHVLLQQVAFHVRVLIAELCCQTAAVHVLLSECATLDNADNLVSYIAPRHAPQADLGVQGYVLDLGQETVLEDLCAGSLVVILNDALCCFDPRIDCIILFNIQPVGRVLNNCMWGTMHVGSNLWHMQLEG